MSSRAQRRRVLRRDNGLCGLHLGGCGKPIKKGEQHNVDHIIPKALFSIGADGSSIAEFNEDWNCQPTHMSCNDSKDFRMDGWPRFDCKCHYLQVCEGDLYIYTKGEVGEGRHKLLSSVVSDDGSTFTLIPGTGKVQGGAKAVGFSQDRFGYVLPGIPAYMVERFNLAERSRAGHSGTKIHSTRRAGTRRG